MQAQVLAVFGLSFPKASGILGPRPEIKPKLPALEGGFLTTGQSGKSLDFLFRSVSTYSAPSSINLLFCSHLANQTHLFPTLPPKYILLSTLS